MWRGVVAAPEVALSLRLERRKRGRKQMLPAPMQCVPRRLLKPCRRECCRREVSWRRSGCRRRRYRRMHYPRTRYPR